MNNNRLKRRIKDLEYNNEIQPLFNGADQFHILNQLIAIEQRVNCLTELVSGYLQERGEQIII